MMTILRWAIAAAAIALTGCGGDKNRAPTTSGGTLTTAEDTTATLTISAADPDGDALTLTVTAPQHGTVSVTGPLVVTYVPAPNYNGADSFSYSVSDAHGASAAGSVSVTVTPQPDAPVVTAQSFTIAEGGSVNGTFAATDADGDAVTFAISTIPAQGAIGSLDPGTGAFTYYANDSFNGDDTFAVTARDATSVSAPAVFTVHITPVNDVPRAANDEATIPVTGTSTVNVLANDYDDDDDRSALTVEIMGTTPGVTAIVSGGSIQLTPVAGARGPTRLAYRVTDPAGATSQAQLRLVIGSATPLFFQGMRGANEPYIFRYDYFRVEGVATSPRATAPVAMFAVSLDGTTLAFSTYSPFDLVRSRAYVIALDEPGATPRELQFASILLPPYMRISPDGTLIAAHSKLANADVGGVVRDIEPGFEVERVEFSADSRRLYYTVLLPGGGRVVKRADVSALADITNRVQLTGDYPTAEGLGVGFRLTPDESRIVSAGLILPIGSPNIRQQAFVTSTDGSRNDARLHPAFTNIVDHAAPPEVTRDGQYAFYVATLGGVSGLYGSDLSAPGSSIQIDHGVSFIANAIANGTSRSVLYRNTSSVAPGGWYSARADQSGTATPFAPLGGALPAPRSVSAAPDGSHVVFDSGADIYSADGDQLQNPTLLFHRSQDVNPSLLYSPDSNTVTVIANATSLMLANPRIPGWFESLPFAPTTECVMYAGGSC